MKPFIPDRTDGRRTESAGRIVLHALGFPVVSRIATALLTAVVQMI